MFKNLRTKFISLIRKYLFFCHRNQLRKEYLERANTVRAFFHEFMPYSDPNWGENKTIIENGIYNYFILPSGNLPKFDFVFPEIPLYIVLGDISSASWPLAHSLGISRDVWEATQEDLKYIETTLPSLASYAAITKIHYLIIRWEEPITPLVLTERVQRAIYEV